MFDSLTDRLSGALGQLRGKGRLSPADVDAVCRDIRIALLDADVALPVVRDFVAAVREQCSGAAMNKALNPTQQVVKVVDGELRRVLGGQTRRLRFAKNPPTVIMLAGLQGSGKTTFAGKLGRFLAEQGHTPLLVACDLQRPNAVTQLQVVGDRIGVPVYAPAPGNTGADETGDPARWGDPVVVAHQAITYARAKLHDVVIIDTAGRLGVDSVLMRQAGDIRDATNPDEVLFVIDSMTGQDAVTTANAFAEGVDFTGVVLTKLDGDARGGVALSVTTVTGRPIMFASTGEKPEDLELFHPDRMASRILGMGDMLTLIEAAERSFDADQAKEQFAKLQNEHAFTLDDFLEQLHAVQKMGSLQSILKMLPGMNQYRDAINAVDDKEITRVEAIIRSMTPAERTDPKLLDGSRRSRIARGSGVTVSDVGQLVERFLAARKMMSGLATGKGIPGIPGTGRPGKGKAPKQIGNRGAKGRSGNPAKRAADAVLAASTPEVSAVAAPAPGSALAGLPGFGGGKAAGNDPLAGFDPSSLPSAFRKALGGGN